MIVENTTQIEIRLRWNRYLKQDVVDFNIGGQWCTVGSITSGKQTFPFGVISETVLASPQMFDCDLKNAETFFREEC